MTKSHNVKKGVDRELPDLNEKPERMGLVEIETTVDRIIASDEKLARQVKLYFSHRYTGLKLKKRGRWYGISESGVTQASRRVRLRIEDDKQFARIVTKIMIIVNV